MSGYVTPLLLDASEDPGLQGAPLRVLLYLHRILDIGEDRPVKVWAVAMKLRVHRKAVALALKRLVALGYLREGEAREDTGTGGWQVRTYRLLITKGETSKREVA